MFLPFLREGGGGRLLSCRAPSYGYIVCPAHWGCDFCTKGCTCARHFVEWAMILKMQGGSIIHWIHFKLYFFSTESLMVWEKDKITKVGWCIITTVEHVQNCPYESMGKIPKHWMTTKINKLLKNLSFGGVLYNWMLFIDFWVYGWILKCGQKCTNVNIQLKVSCLSLWWFNLWVGIPVSMRQHLHVRNESKNVILMTGTEVAKTKLVGLWDKASKVQRPKSLSQRYFGNNSRMWGQWITSTIHIWVSVSVYCSK